MRWDAARTASRRPLPKPRKLHGPVGDEALNTQGAVCDAEATYLRHGARTCFPHDSRCEEMACSDCGHIVCSCDRTVALEALREHGVITVEYPLWNATLPPEQQIMGDHIAKRRAEDFNEAFSREVEEEQPGYVSPEDARRLMGSISGLNSVVRGCGYCGRTDGAHETDCRALHEALSANFRDIVEERRKSTFTAKLDLAQSIAKLVPLDRDAIRKLLTTGDWR